MLPTNLINGIKAYSNTGSPLIESPTNATKSTTKFEPGQLFQGSVISKASDGLFNVQVAGQTIQMRLPGNLRSGDSVKLEVVATRPRIMFNMIPSTNPLSNSEQISATARILSNLAELPSDMQTVQQLGNNAIWSTEQQAPDAKLLASNLREALGKSGLFYESHQAQWVRGERSTDQLLDEPQNVITGKNLLASSPDYQSTLEVKANSLPPQEILREKGSDAYGTNAEHFAIADKAASLSATKELLNLLQQQLHTLEKHQLTWIGQIWPEQNMQWTIQGEQEHQAKHESERQWSTEIELDLPCLGDIKARLVFTTSGLLLTLHTADTKIMALFNQTLPQLKNSLADADITLISAIVEKR